MFIETMTGKELFGEYYADLSEIQAKTLSFDRSEYIANYLWKRHKQTRVVVTKSFTTSRNNTYIGLLTYTQSGIGKKKMWNMFSIHVGLMNTARGPCAIVFYEDSQKAIKFTSHFFRRYKERLMPVTDWKTRNDLARAKSDMDIISIYIKRNPSMTWIETETEFRDNVHIFGPVNDGVALLQWNKRNKLLQANTFVTPNMLNAKQSKMVAYTNTYLSLPKAQRMKYQFPYFIQDDENSVN